MPDTQFIRTLGLIVVAAAVMVLVGRRFGVPSIVSSMLAGFLLVPVLGLIEAGAVDGDGAGSLALVSEVGIVLLLFLVGLELSVEEIREVGAVAVVAALGQSLVMGVLVLLLALAMDMTAAGAIILAIAVGFSSTVVVVKQLESRGELDRPFGRISVGILLVQDLVVVIVLTVLAGLSSAAGADGTADGAVTLGPVAIALSLLRAFGLMAALLVATLLCSRFVLPPVFGRIDRSPAAGMVAALAWCFVLVEAAALMGLSVEIGAFLAGIGLGGLPHRNDLRRRVKPLMGFFIAVFFASLGSRIDLGDLLARWPLALGLTLLVLLVKPPVFRLLTGLMGAGRRTGVDVAITLAQISEFSLILGAAAITVPGLLTEDDVAAMGMLGPVALVTIIVSVVAMSLRESIHRRLGTPPEIPKPAEAAAAVHHDPPPAGHVVVVGMNPLGRGIVHALAARGVAVVAVDTDARKLAELPAARVLGDVEHAEARDEAAMSAARLVVCALRIESANRMLALRCGELGVPVVLHAFDRSLRPEFERLGPVAIIDSKAGADLQVDALLAAAGIPGLRREEAAAC